MSALNRLLLFRTYAHRVHPTIVGGAWANFITFSVAPQIAYVEVSIEDSNIATTIHLAKEGVVCLLQDRICPPAPRSNLNHASQGIGSNKALIQFH